MSILSKTEIYTIHTALYMVLWSFHITFSSPKILSSIDPPPFFSRLPLFFYGTFPKAVSRNNYIFELKKFLRCQIDWHQLYICVENSFALPNWLASIIDMVLKEKPFHRQIDWHLLYILVEHLATTKLIGVNLILWVTHSGWWDIDSH